MIFYFPLGCFTFPISYSVLPFGLVYAFQFLCLFFFFDVLLKSLSRIVEKLLYIYDIYEYIIHNVYYIYIF